MIVNTVSNGAIYNRNIKISKKTQQQTNSCNKQNMQKTFPYVTPYVKFSANTQRLDVGGIEQYCMPKSNLRIVYLPTKNNSNESFISMAIHTKPDEKYNPLKSEVTDKTIEQNAETESLLKGTILSNHNADYGSTSTTLISYNNSEFFDNLNVLKNLYIENKFNERDFQVAKQKTLKDYKHLYTEPKQIAQKKYSNVLRENFDTYRDKKLDEEAVVKDQINSLENKDLQNYFSHIKSQSSVTVFVSTSPKNWNENKQKLFDILSPKNNEQYKKERTVWTSNSQPYAKNLELEYESPMGNQFEQTRPVNINSLKEEVAFNIFRNILNKQLNQNDKDIKFDCYAVHTPEFLPHEIQEDNLTAPVPQYLVIDAENSSKEKINKQQTYDVIKNSVLNIWQSDISAELANEKQKYNKLLNEADPKYKHKLLLKWDTNIAKLQPTLNEVTPKDVKNIAKEVFSNQNAFTKIEVLGNEQKGNAINFGQKLTNKKIARSVKNTILEYINVVTKKIHLRMF